MFYRISEGPHTDHQLSSEQPRQRLNPKQFWHFQHPALPSRAHPRPSAGKSQPGASHGGDETPVPSRSPPRGPCRAQPQHSRTLTWQPFTSLPKPKPTKSPNPQKNTPRTTQERLGRECRLHSSGELNERWKFSDSTPASPQCSLTPFCSPACWRQIEPTSKGPARNSRNSRSGSLPALLPRPDGAKQRLPSSPAGPWACSHRGKGARARFQHPPAPVAGRTASRSFLHGDVRRGEQRKPALL